MIHILLAIIALSSIPSLGLAESVSHSYPHELIEQARQARLADEREWHLLLHYQRNFLGEVTSEEDDPGFFLSPDGKHDPQAELDATITQLFSADPVGRSKQPAQCAFIARYHWLKERLRFDPERLTPVSCGRFDRWRAEMNPQGVSLIFPAAFLNNPASMFGHTFLRIDQKGQTELTRILAYTIDYAAEVPPGAGIEYAYMGIFGGYKGFFSTPPYYLKVQNYRDIENRDMWEYPLNLTADQIDRLLMHAWEMGNAYFDYFFFKENCSYHILSLLEYANPDLHLRDRFSLWTIPADTVRAIVDSPGLVGTAVYRPSRSTVIKRKRESLPAKERDLAHGITQDLRALASPAFTQLNLSKQAFLLDLASDYLRYRIETTDSPKPEWKERNKAVLVTRSQLRIPSEEFTVRPFAKQPELGHKTSRVVVGGGWRNNDTFEEATVRAGYHDLLDPEIGYTPDAQIEMASITVRHYNRASQTRVERATLLNLLSLSPIDSVFRAPSWKVNVGMNTIHHNECQLCSNGVFNGGIGAAKELRFLSREVLFAFAETEANVSKAYDEMHRVGGGGTVGMLADLTERWKIMATGSYLRFPFGDKSDEFRWFVGSRYTLSRNWGLRIEYNHRHRDNDVMVGLHAFF